MIAWAHLHQSPKHPVGLVVWSRILAHLDFILNRGGLGNIHRCGNDVGKCVCIRESLVVVYGLLVGLISRSLGDITSDIQGVSGVMVQVFGSFKSKFNFPGILEKKTDRTDKCVYNLIGKLKS